MKLSAAIDTQVEVKNPELNLLIVDDYKFVQLLTTFKNINLPEIPDTILNSEISILDSWRYAHLPIVAWAKLTGLSAKEVRRLSTVLKNNLIILPDGRVNAGVYKFALSIGQNRLINTVANLKKKQKETTNG